MLKRVLILIGFLMLMVSVAQAQDGEFLGIDAGSYTPGSWINVRWRVTHAEVALLQIYDLAHPDVPVDGYRGLPPEGVREIFLPVTLVHGVRVVLYAANLNTKVFTYVPMYDVLRSQALELPVDSPALSATLVPTPAAAGACLPISDSSQDDSRCLPTREGTVQAAYEPFENGFMLWRADSGEVWMLEKSGVYVRYSETVFGLMPDNPIPDVPPTGRSSPANGFGRVWGNVEDVRKALGWALGPEVGYTMTVHYAAEPFASPYIFMSL
ncbi:MAG: hypothetical protein ABI700_28010, partial [Chloroflexota bacterium]